MSMLTAIALEEITQRGSIRDGDVIRLAAAYAVTDVVSEADADALFALHAACPIQAPSWSEFFIDALCDYVVNQARPAGYAVAENTRWLIERIGRFGRVETSTELALLVRVLEAARWTPPSLAAFGLAQIRHAVATGTGPLRAKRDVAKGTITLGDVELAARLLRTFGAENSIAVTRAEADELIAINRALAEGQSTPAWSGLFVRAVGTGVLAALGHAVPARRDMLADCNDALPASELSALMGPSEATGEAERCLAARHPAAVQVWSSSPMLSPEERALARLERQRHEIVTNEVIEEATDVWLMTRLSETPGLERNEAAVLSFVAREANRLPAGLADFAARTAVAA